jgi:putative hydrolase of the HAD superfamily
MLAGGLMLDIGGVVLRGGVAIADLLADEVPELSGAAAEIGVATPRDRLWVQMLSGEVTERFYWSTRSADLGAVMGEVWDTRMLINRLYHRPTAELLNHDVIDLMLEVKSAGLPLVALTNDLAAFHGPVWVAEQEWLRHFDTIVDGSLTGVLKPDPRAFAAGAEAIGLPPPQIVFLDDMPWNVAGGAAAGLQAIQVDGSAPAAAVNEARHRLFSPL